MYILTFQALILIMSNRCLKQMQCPNSRIDHHYTYIRYTYVGSTHAIGTTAVIFNL